MGLPASLRRQLEALGVPEELQTAEGLCAFFPPEFNIEEAALDAETLGGMLLRFAERRVIDLPLRVPSEVLPPGLHACQFYRSQDELFDFVTPYFRRGLADGLLCVWIVSDPLTPALAARALKDRIVGWDGFVARGQMEVGHERDCYTNGAGGMRPIEEILGGFETKSRDGLRRGFAGLRAVGDTSWCARLEDVKPYFEYERRVSSMLNGKRMTGLCTYSMREFPPFLVDGILDAHRESFMKKGLSWEGFRDYREARTSVAQALRELAAA